MTDTANSYSFADLVNLVYTETNRPDLIDQTASAVRASTLKMHGIMGNFFYKDLTLAYMPFNQSGFFQTISTDELINFRKIKHIRKWDPNYLPSQLNLMASNLLPAINSIYGIVSPNEALAPFEMIEVDDIFDGYKAEKTNVCYQMGNQISLKSSTVFSKCLVHYYKWPSLGIADAGASYSSWIANEHPYCIIYDAAASLYRSTGDSDSFAQLTNPRTGLLPFEVASLVASNAVSKGD